MLISRLLHIIIIGISVRISGEGDALMHHKFCLIDGTSAKGVLITGSLNWTYTVCVFCPPKYLEGQNTLLELCTSIFRDYQKIVKMLRLSTAIA